MEANRELRITSGIALISAGSLVYEIALTRLLAVQQFHHFAFLVVSLAVLGMAASGVTLSGREGSIRLHRVSAAYGLTTIAAYLVINLLPFDSFSIAWDARQVWILLLYFLAAGVPFLFAGRVVGAALVRSGEGAFRPYAASLAGSALGCLIAPLILALGGVEAALGLAAVLGFLASFVFAAAARPRAAALLLAALSLTAFTRLPAWLRLSLSPYKPLQVAMLSLDAEVTLSRWSATSRVDVIESSGIHVTPGLALSLDVDLPEQAGLFLDGEGPMPVTRAAARTPATCGLAERMPGSLGYLLRPQAYALIIEPGAGLNTLLAFSMGAAHVVQPTDDPLVKEVMLEDYREYSHGLFADPALEISTRTSRGTLSEERGPFDVIEFALSEGFRPVTSGAFSLTEDFSMTVEAIQQAWDQLEQDGLLVITRWIHTPPSESARAWSTVLAALRARGVTSTGEHVLAYRGMRTATIIASRRPFSPAELATARAFLIHNRFDPIYLPGLRAEELNRFNRLPEPVYHQLYAALLESYDRTVQEYDFRLEAPSDDRPYFSHFFRWSQTPQVLASLGRIWQPFGGSGYFVLLALLLLMLILATALTLLPAALLRRKPGARPPSGALAYFAALGLGYLAVEIPLIQAFGLLLDRPMTSLVTVLFTLLLTSGVGSFLSPRIRLRTALWILAVLLLVDLILLLPFTHWALPLSLPARIMLASLFMLPTGVLMGVPFAAGLAMLERRAPGWIPWAWAVNGALSGVSGVTAALISLDAGFRATLFAGLCAYALAAVLSSHLSSGGLSGDLARKGG